VIENRDLQMKALRSSGLTLEVIGQKFGVSRERVRQIVGPAPRATECQVCGEELLKDADVRTKYCGAKCRNLAANTQSAIKSAHPCPDCGSPCRGKRCKPCVRKERAALRTSKYAKLEALWAEGLPMSEIAEELDTTANALGGMLVRARAAGCDLPKRRGGPKRENLTKGEARFQFSAELLKGNIRRPKRCEDCGEETYVEGHHTDYQRPLFVFWLCEDCHLKAHGKRTLDEVLAA
jgi:transposase